MSALRATRCWIVGCMCPWSGSPTTRMRNGAGSAACPPSSRSKPSPSWPRRCSPRWCRPRPCGVVGWWRTRRLGATQAFWMGWRGWACGIVAEVPHTTRVWDERPATHVPPWRGRGRRPQRERLVAGAPDGADGAGGGDGAARRGVDTPDDQRRQSGTHGGGVCYPAGGGCAGRLARS